MEAEEAAKLRKLATHILPLEEWEQGFAMMRSGEAVKISRSICKAEEDLDVYRADHVAMSVEDMEKAIAFYRDVVGMEKVFDREFGEGMARLIGVRAPGCASCT